MSLSIEALRRRLTACMNLDARRLSSRLHGVKKLPEAKQAAVLETIAATDYSRLDQAPRVQALSEPQSGFSENFLAT